MLSTQSAPPKTPLGVRMKRTLLAVIILAATAFLVVYMHDFMAPLKQSDWSETYYVAAHALMRLRSPYGAGFFNPPWVLIPLLPIALLPTDWGNALMFVLNLVAFLFVFIRLKISPWLYLPLIFFSGVMSNSIYGNIDGFCALGLILPPQIGLFFVMAKPQIGIVVALFWTLEAWNKGGWRRVVKTFAPVSGAYLLSFVLFGNWMSGSAAILGAWWNTSIFPWGIPIGLILFGLAVWRKQLGYAMAAGPFFAPYVNFFTWSFCWIGLAAALPFGALGTALRAILRKKTGRQI